MKYEQLKRRCESALRDAIESGDDTLEETIRGILEAVEAGPLRPGDVVDSSEMSPCINPTFGATATVMACWFEERTGQWWATVEDDCHSMVTANARWFAQQTYLTERDRRQNHQVATTCGTRG